MADIKIILITTICLLRTITAWAAGPSASASRINYNHAVESFRNAQRAEETARLSSYASDIANYYKEALKEYKYALEKAQRSAKDFEELSREERDNRDYIISKCLRKIKICSNKYDDALYRKYYDNALRDFDIAQKAEESAKRSSYPANIADYYQMAIKSYNQALKIAQRSAEELEELSKREKYNRQRMINKCRERIEVCEKEYAEALVGATIESLKQQAHKYIIAGFNYVNADDKSSAKRTWNEALRLYNEALLQTYDMATREMLKSKIEAVKHYLEYCD